MKYIFETITDEQFNISYNSANPWFVLLYMRAFLLRWDELQDEEKRKMLIHEIYNGGKGPDKNYDGTKTRVNSLYRIIRSGRAIEAMEQVIMSDKLNEDFMEEYCAIKKMLVEIKKGKSVFPWIDLALEVEYNYDGYII